MWVLSKHWIVLNLTERGDHLLKAGPPFLIAWNYWSRVNQVTTAISFQPLVPEALAIPCPPLAIGPSTSTPHSSAVSSGSGKRGNERKF